MPALRERSESFDVVTGSNVFPHNAEPGPILEAALDLLSPEGVFIVEVMYAGDLLEQLQWDTLYHEHLTFYSLHTLATLLARYGLEVVEAERMPMHGGSLRAAAAREGAREPGAGVAELRRWEDEAGLNQPATWDGFGADSRRRIDVFGDHRQTAVGVVLDLGVRRRGQGDDVGQRVRDGLPRGRRQRLAAAGGKADARHPHADRLAG